MSATSLHLILTALRLLIEDTEGTNIPAQPNLDRSLRLRLAVYNLYHICRSILDHGHVYYDRDIPRLDFAFHTILRRIHSTQGTHQHGRISDYPTR